MSYDNEYDCPHCGKENVGMFGHECPESQANTVRREKGEELVYVSTRFSRNAICPNCSHRFLA